MEDTQILSTLQESVPQPEPAGSAPALVFDACSVSVVLRAVLFVELAIAAVVMFGSRGVLDWLARLSLVTDAALPAVLEWLLLACLAKHILDRLAPGLQYLAAVMPVYVRQRTDWQLAQEDDVLDGIPASNVAFKLPTEQRSFTMSHHLDQNAQACIDNCNVCATECDNCFSHMVGTESVNACPSCCVECAAICRLCADAIARNSPFANQICKLCADICEWCARECGAHDMDHCKRCAEACLQCSAACRNMNS